MTCDNSAASAMDRNNGRGYASSNNQVRGRDHYPGNERG
jgi:hypothetical protein